MNFSSTCSGVKYTVSVFFLFPHSCFDIWAIFSQFQKKFRLARGETKKGKRAKGQRAIQEPWGGHSQDENQNRSRPPRPSNRGCGTQSNTTKEC